MIGNLTIAMPQAVQLSWRNQKYRGNEQMPVNPQHEGKFPSSERIERELPKYLRERGGPQASIPADRVYKPLADLLGVPANALNLTRKQYYIGDHSDAPAWNNLVQWAVRQLRKRGEMEPASRGHGQWTLSAKTLAKLPPPSK